MGRASCEDLVNAQNRIKLSIYRGAKSEPTGRPFGDPNLLHHAPRAVAPHRRGRLPLPALKPAGFGSRKLKPTKEQKVNRAAIALLWLLWLLALAYIYFSR
jgi:hypothetical protein